MKIVNLKKKSVWLIGSFSGLKFNDNSKYLYLYLVNNTAEHVYWYTKEKKIYCYLKKKKYPVVLAGSFKALMVSIFAKYLVISYSFDDVGYFAYLFHFRKKIIQLYHGTPLKKLKYQGNPLLKKVFMAYLGRPCDLLISCSEKSKALLLKFFQISPDKIKVTGCPRNDILTSKKSDEDNLVKKFSNKKIILFLPTFRSYKGAKDIMTLLNMSASSKELDYVLQQLNAIMIIKYHFKNNGGSDQLKSISNFNNIYQYSPSPEKDDIYPLLKSSTILITDYSSVYFDFLLLNKPIVFFPYDLKDYLKKDVGLYLNYQNVTPGIKTYTVKGLARSIKRYILNPDYLKKERSLINEQFNKFSDDFNSKRVYDEIKKL